MSHEKLIYSVQIALGLYVLVYAYVYSEPAVKIFDYIKANQHLSSAQRVEGIHDLLGVDNSLMSKVGYYGMFLFLPVYFLHAVIYYFLFSK